MFCFLAQKISEYLFHSVYLIVFVINNTNTNTNSGFVLENNIEGYVDGRSKYVEKGKGPEFKQAVQEMDDYLRSPTVRVPFHYINSTTYFESTSKYSSNNELWHFI